MPAELAVSMLIGSLLCCLAATIWGNHVIPVASSVARHTALQTVTAVLVAALLAHSVDNLWRENDDDVLEVPFETIFFTASIGTAVLVSTPPEQTNC